MATTNSFYDREQRSVLEIINKGVEMFLPGYDPIFRDMISSNMGVTPMSELGRDYMIRKRYMGGLTGVIDQGVMSGDVALDGDLTTALGSKLQLQTSASGFQTFPDPRESPAHQSYELAIPMRSWLTNLPITLGEQQMDVNPNTIREFVLPKLEGFARNLAQKVCTYFWLSQNSSYSLCVVASPSTSTNVVTFSPLNNAIDRFNVGDRIDFYPSTGLARKNDTTATEANQTAGTRINVIVTAVDYLTNIVTCESHNRTTGAAISVSAWTGAASVVAGDLVTYANTKLGTGAFTGLAGANSFLKFGASSDTAAQKQILGSEAVSGATIDVSVHPEFRSFYKDLAGAPLTEHALRQYLARFHHAVGNKYGYHLDCLIASDGVWLAYAGQKIGRERIERADRVASINAEGLDDGMTFAFEGRTYKGYTSQWVESGSVYGLRTKGNWRKVTPPPLPMTTGAPQVEGFVPFQFVAGALSGTSSNRLPVYLSSSTGNASLPTEMSQMPGWMRLQCYPETQIPGLKLVNCAEDRTFSGTGG